MKGARGPSGIVARASAAQLLTPAPIIGPYPYQEKTLMTTRREKQRRGEGEGEQRRRSACG